ncbi:DUF5926 family protein [uncultured Corynebacterium sp.]|uniref:DUF5926 family protein n=1 Tax=uncultured Corynebacterium sp. TaxID=159447 RepID=UPI0025EE73C3|nr:DUF5926 family protein [uncultured Corynebacterium sp.]
MGKKSRKNRAESNADLPEGMSRRQAKLAARAAERERLAGNPRPFAGFEAEADLVALREFAPSATVPAQVVGAKRPIHLCTVLPGGIAALTRATAEGGAAYVAMQTQSRSNDGAADLARALEWAREADDGEQLESSVDGLDGGALGDILTGIELDELVVHQDFEWWIPAGVERTQLVQQNLAVANESIMPSHRLDLDVPGAVWWIDPGERAHIRWIRGEDERTLLDALARIHAADRLTMGEGTKFAGVFRTDGVLVPVWDLDNTVAHDSWGTVIADAAKRIDAALGVDDALTTEERKSRETIVSRQVTIR